MKLSALFVLSIAVSLFAGCHNASSSPDQNAKLSTSQISNANPENQIVGQWEFPQGGPIFQFESDHRLIVRDGDAVVTGTWSYQNSEYILDAAQEPAKALIDSEGKLAVTPPAGRSGFVLTRSGAK